VDDLCAGHPPGARLRARAADPLDRGAIRRRSSRRFSGCRCGPAAPRSVSPPSGRWRN